MKKKTEKIRYISIKDLNWYESVRYQKFKYISKHINDTNEFLAYRLSCSIRTISRIRKEIKESEKYNDNGKQILKVSHGNKSNNYRKKYEDKIFLEANKEILNVEKEIIPEDPNNHLSYKNYFNINKNNLNCSRSTFYRRSNELGFCSGYAKSKTKKKCKEILKEKLKLKNDKIIKMLYTYNMKKIENSKVSVYQNKAQFLEFGQQLQVDGCFHSLWGKTKNNKKGEKVCIYSCVDAGTGMVLALHAEKQETTVGYQKLLDKVFDKYGLPQTIRSDCRTTMYSGENNETPFAKALFAKGIELSSSTNPKFKPHVERGFDTMQNNLPFLFNAWKINKEEKYKVSSIDEFNKKSELITNWYNSEFKKNSKGKINVFREPDRSRNEHLMLLKIERKVYSGIVKFDNKYWAPFDKNGNRVYMENKDKVSLVRDGNNKLLFSGNGKLYEAKQPNGKEITPHEIWAIKHGCQTSPEVIRLAKIYAINSSFTSHNIDKIERVVSKVDDENTRKEVVNMLENISKQLKELREEYKKIKKDSIERLSI